MPSVQATTVKCPECGARLEVADGSSSTTCTYCGTQSRVQRRTQVFQLPVRLAPPTRNEPIRVAREVRSGSGGLIGGLIVLAIIGGIVALILKKANVFGTEISWDGAVPVVADVNGDGVEDFVGWDRNVQKDTMKLTAFSGKNGSIVWQTGSLGKYNDVYQDGLFYAGGAILVWDQAAHLQAFDAKGGAKRWRVDTSEIVKGACSAGDQVIVQTADGKQWTVAMANGALAAAQTASCEPDTSPWHDVTGGRKIREREVEIDGMHVDSVIQSGAGPLIAAGYRYPGTGVPMVAAVSPDGKLLWKMDVPGHDPLKADTGEPKAVGISDKEVAVAYQMNDHNTPAFVTVFDRATGTRRFDVQVAKTFMNVLSSVTITKQAVAVSLWGSLQTFDPTTGKRLFVIGH